MSLCGFAQSIVCAEGQACDPITDQTFSTTSVPYYCADELTFEQGEAVDVCITIKCPATTNVDVEVPILGSVNADASIESLTITGFSNLPEGLSYCVNRVDMDPTTNVYATIHITGTAPNENGDYNLQLSGNFTGTASAMGYNYPLNDEAVTFATGIVITIGEGGEDPETPEIVCETPCDPVTNQTMSQTTIPYYAPEELTYNVNEAVDVCITIQCPATTTVEYMSMEVDATISGLTITGFSNLPDGLSYCVSRVDMDPTTNNFATLHITGTPTTANEYNLNISCNVTGTANAFGSNVPLNNQAVTFPTGIVITIEEESSNAVVANFTTNPEATQLLGGSAVYITAGETITYTNTSENATSIAWTFEGGTPATSTESTVTVTYATAGNYTTTLTAYGANNEESTKTVGVNVSEPQPQNEVVADFTTNPAATNDTINITINGTVVFTNSSTNADSIAWTFEGGNPETSSDAEVTVTYATAGTYTATLTAYDEEETAADTKSVTIVVGTSAVDETSISEISVYPNPTSSVINIAAEGMQNITIMDMAGRVVMSKDVNSNFETINAEGFAKANYMVRIATADGVVVKSIVVE
jgi:PKD repeat protein